MRAYILGVRQSRPNLTKLFHVTRREAMPEISSFILFRCTLASDLNVKQNMSA